MRHSGAEIDPVATFLLHFPKQILYIAIILALEHKYIQTFIRINNHEDPLCTISSFRRNSTVTIHVKKTAGKNTLYGIDNTENSETVLKYQISDFP